MGFDKTTVHQMRQLVGTILGAANTLARLLPNEELEQGFEFPCGHSNSSRVVEMSELGNTGYTCGSKCVASPQAMLARDKERKE